MSAPTESTPPPHMPVPPHAPVHVPLPPPPPGTAFALGWLMAELFDDRRRRILDVRQPPFSQAVQLPLVADLDEPDLLKFLVTDLHDLLRPYHDVSDARVSDARVQAEAAKRQPGSAEPFDKGAFDKEVNALHLAILDRFADDQQQLNAYQLGLALSDLCWLPGAAGLDSITGMFRRDQIAAMQTWLNGAGTAIPQSTGAIVGQSLGHWADWADVNAATLRATGAGTALATTVISALRVQGAVWHSVLTADPDVSLNPAMGAWVQAGSAMVRAVRMLAGVIIRRFWPVVLIVLAALAGLLYLIIANLSGASQVWGSLVTVAVVVGAAGGGIFGGVSRALGGVGYDIWNAARREAQVWSITWLPAMAQGVSQRAKLESRGVAAPNIRKNLEG
jgi:hypothetical protein